MKKILILTTHYALGEKHSWLVDILAEELAKKCSVNVAFMDWKGEINNSLYEKNGVKIYADNLAVLQGGGKFRKSLKWLFSGDFFYSKYKKSLFMENYDCVIAFAPVVVYRRIIKKIKNKSDRFYLILWDFFPDYHSQLGLINKRLNFLYDFLEQNAYRLFDRVGLMSEANIEYYKNNKKNVQNQAMEVFPLWGPPVKKDSIKKNKNLSRKFVFGGQLIKGRGLDVLIDVAHHASRNGMAADFFIFGDGPERENFENKVFQLKLKNIFFKGFVPREEYFDFLCSADVGLVFNSGTVKVPTYPSKAIDFYRAGLPILAYVEEATDFGNILEKEIGAGFYANSKNRENIFVQFDKIMGMNENELNAMGVKGREYFDAVMRVDHAARRIMKYIEGEG